MLLQIRYNKRLDNSVTSEACSLFLTVLSQTLVPEAFLSKRPNFRLERILLRRDEVVRKRSSRGAVFAVCLIWVGPRRSQFAEICSVVDLLSIRDVGNAEQRPDMPAVSIPMAVSRCSNVIHIIPGRRPIIDFQRLFSNFCAYDKKALEQCTV